MNEQWWSWALTAVGVACFWLAGRKVWWSWYVGLGGQVTWLAYSLITEQWGFLVGVGVYSAVYARNAYTWTRDRHGYVARVKPPRRWRRQQFLVQEDRYRGDRVAGFVPEHDDLQEIVYRIASRVSATFQDAETRLLAEIARRLIRDLPELPELDRQLRIMQELERFAGELTAGITRELAEEIVAQATREGAAAVLTDQLPRIPAIAALADAHVLAASLIAWDLGNAFADVKARILRYPRDAMREFMVGGDVYQDVIAANAPMVALGASTSTARKAALQAFLERGVTGFTDVAGRNWRVGTYTEMATRTAVARAYTDAGVYRNAQLGIDLYSILGGRNSCDSRAQWFGKIIAASGPTGLRRVPHAYEDRLIEVDVAATLAQWRQSGAGHPNCTCRPVGYLPGFRLPVAASGYDAAAHAARDRLRELEVRERDAKRKYEIAAAAGDSEKALRERRRILVIQAETRDHVKATGQRRRYERAQVRFADGSH